MSDERPKPLRVPVEAVPRRSAVSWTPPPPGPRPEPLVPSASRAPISAREENGEVDATPLAGTATIVDGNATAAPKRRSSLPPRIASPSNPPSIPAPAPTPARDSIHEPSVIVDLDAADNIPATGGAVTPSAPPPAPALPPSPELPTSEFEELPEVDTSVSAAVPRAPTPTPSEPAPPEALAAERTDPSIAVEETLAPLEASPTTVFERATESATSADEASHTLPSESVAVDEAFEDERPTIAEMPAATSEPPGTGPAKEAALEVVEEPKEEKPVVQVASAVIIRGMVQVAGGVRDEDDDKVVGDSQVDGTKEAAEPLLLEGEDISIDLDPEEELDPIETTPTSVRPSSGPRMTAPPEPPPEARKAKKDTVEIAPGQGPLGQAAPKEEVVEVLLSTEEEDDEPELTIEEATDGESHDDLELELEDAIEDGERASSAPPPPPEATEKAAPPAMPDAPPRPRQRPWFETFFNSDYLRSVPPPLPKHVDRELDFMERALDLAPGARILDVGCGLGLHSVGLSRRGYSVVGIDLSESMLSMGRSEAKDLGLSTQFVHGDMREMAFDAPFDAVICWGTSLGYFDDDQNRMVIQRLYQALKPKGALLLDVVNRDHVIQQQPNLVWFEGDGCVCMEESKFNYFQSRLLVKRTVILDNGMQTENAYSLRLYAPNELGKLLHAQGFRVTEISGMLVTPGVFFGASSPRMIILAERRAETKTMQQPPPPPAKKEPKAEVPEGEPVVEGTEEGAEAKAEVSGSDKPSPSEGGDVSNAEPPPNTDEAE